MDPFLPVFLTAVAAAGTLIGAATLSKSIKMVFKSKLGYGTSFCIMLASFGMMLLLFSITDRLSPAESPAIYLGEFMKAAIVFFVWLVVQTLLFQALLKTDDHQKIALSKALLLGAIQTAVGFFIVFSLFLLLGVVVKWLGLH